MSTNAKIIIGYTDHTGYWNTTQEFVRWSDGYSEMVIPQLREHLTDAGIDIAGFNDAMKYDAWKLTDITDNSYEYGQMNYHYYIDQSNTNKIRVSVLVEDDAMFMKYNVMNMKVEKELVL